MLHFRSFIIPALMAGAALFLPNQAFAEKHEPNGQANSHVVEAQSLKNVNKVVTKVNVPLKPQQVKTVVEKKAAVPAPASKAQGQAVQHVLKKAVLEKPPEVKKPLPPQANGNAYGHSEQKKKEQPAVVSPIKEDVPETPTERADGTVAVVKNTSVSKEPVSVESRSKQVESIDQVSSVTPVTPVKDKVPASKEEPLAVDQVFNPAPRSNSGGGGQSSDRVSQGLHTISFLEKWFEWNRHYELKLVHPFLSRYNLKHQQWVNAPPSPPPKTAPFLNTVTRRIQPTEHAN